MKTSTHTFRLLLLSLAAILTTTALAQTGTPSQYFFTTLAGISSVGSADGTGSSARFNRPGAITMDSSGNLFVADTVNHLIRKINFAGVVTTVAGQPGTAGSADGTGSAARFNRPYGITVDSIGNLYVTDTSNSTIRKIISAGVVTTIAGTAGASDSLDGNGSAARFNRPSGITVDSSGTLYVADTGNNLIRKISPSGVVTTVAGAPGTYQSTDGAGSAARFNSPSGIVVDPAGNLYVGESTMIRKITPSGDVTTLAGIASPVGSADGFGYADGTESNARFSGVSGITRDLAGNLYSADASNSTIRKITLAGVVTTVAGQVGQLGFANGNGNQARFFQPLGVVADPTGNLYVADTGNNIIRKVNPMTTILSTVAGLAPAQCIGSTDGGAEARFFNPEGLAVGPVGELYVADHGNHTVRKISPTGNVTTVAGLAGNASHADGSATSARFNFPSDVAVDAIGNIYVADTGNSVIRKITPGGIVSTVAGQPGVTGNTDGSADTALFSQPSGVAVDATGNLYVSESNRIRKISPAGQVTTLPNFSQPDSALTSVKVDGVGNIYACDATYEDIIKITPAGVVTCLIPHLFAPYRLAVDSLSNIFMTDLITDTIWKLSAAGVLTQIGGQPYETGSTTGIGTDARFDHPSGIAVDSTGTIYISCGGITLPFLPDSTIRKGQVAGPPVISAQPLNQTVIPGESVNFSVTAGGVPAPTYQWVFNGNAFAGATSNTLSFTSARSSDAGDYSVVVTNSLGSVTSNRATLTVSAAPAPTSTPTPTPTPTGSGGGGSIEAWFVLTLLALVGMRGRTFCRVE